MSNVLILGAGIYQVPLIRTARDMGLTAMVAGSPGPYPGLALADRVFPVNFLDLDAITAIVRENHIDAIATAGMDLAVTTIGHVCTTCGLSGLSADAAFLVSDKWRMKQAFSRAGVRTAAFLRLPVDGGESALLRALADGALALPFMLKAVDNSGSRGIVKVSCAEDISRALQLVADNTKKDYCLAEEFIDGEELGAEGFLSGGELRLLLPNGKYVYQGDTNVPVGHFAPCELSDALLQDIRLQTGRAAAACGLDNTPINVDLLIQGDKAFIVEIAGRSGATCLPEIVSHACGFNYYEKILLAALGERPDFTPVKSLAAAGHLLMPHRDGTLRAQRYAGPASPHIRELSFDFAPGREVKKFRNGSHRCGQVVVTGETLAQADSLLKEVLGHIQMEIS